ncbi:hypothetical protein [Microvirga lotononidis]|uniref:hypothetical protein n=1 Tax=Microvirga lotononidis TaxID=864069 RepID=UPI0012B5941E|nr:hypothetical protein [Microvirga lotononidis]WQO29023.1 hypothetical protein U0023_08130 [Microvirga lotononidis]
MTLAKSGKPHGIGVAEARFLHEQFDMTKRWLRDVNRLAFLAQSWMIGFPCIKDVKQSWPF